MCYGERIAGNPLGPAFVFGTKEVIWSGIHEAYVLIFAEPQGLAIKEGERFLQEWMPIGLCWRVIQKWADKHRWDRTNSAYNAIKEIAKEILADGLKFLEDYRDPRPARNPPLHPPSLPTTERCCLVVPRSARSRTHRLRPQTDGKTGVSSIDSFHCSLC
jgi:hypothetical protein